MVELDRYNERQLLAAEAGAYPLIVRMETVTDKGLAEGHSLQACRGSIPTVTSEDEEEAGIVFLGAM